jgi:Domain of unknown function (DUF4150)
MANEVYANGMEIACKAASGKSIAAFPDTCLSPPSPPAGPVPVPYPNTASASDTSNGSTTVMISDQEVMLKDQSVFKTSTGNEAATKSLGMGVVTHTIQGEASFVAWSMDVKFEGANVDRHLDLMAQNEQSLPQNPPNWPYTSKQAPSDDGDSDEREKCDPPTDGEKPLVYGPSARGALAARAEEIGGVTLTSIEKPMELSWTQFSLQTLDEAAAAGRPIVFDLTHMQNIPGVLDGTAFPNAVTSKELRHIKENWSGFRDVVHFCKDGKRAERPW